MEKNKSQVSTACRALNYAMMRETSQKRGEKMDGLLSFSKRSKCDYAGDGGCRASLASDQWHEYPNADIITDDIISGQAYVAF